MKRAALSDLSAASLDVLVVGGGIYGIMATRDAALRGLRVALVERDDFGGETSHNSLKIMHGGIRYVQHLDFGRLRASARERAFWQAAAPDLSRPLDFIIPLFGHGIRGPGAFAAAAKLYALASTGLRGPGYGGAGIVLPRTARRQLGDLAPEGLSGGGVWRDGQIQDMNRLHLSALRSAADHGAQLANHVEVLSLVREGNAVTGARLRDTLSGDEVLVRAGVTICCAGAATPDLAEHAIPGASAHFPGFARAMNIVVDRPAPDRAMGIVSQSRADAVVDRGGRMYFVTPWQGRMIIGTQEDPAPDRVARNTADLGPFLKDLAQAAPALGLTEKDVLWVHQGLIPAETDDGPGGVKRMTKGTLIDHADADRTLGLISVVGVKYTTARLIAERAITRACVQLGREDAAAKAPLSFDTPLAQVGAEVTSDTDLQVQERLHAAFETEMAMTLADAVIRRTRLAERGDIGAGGVDRLTRPATEALGWDEGRATRERDGLARELAASTP